MSFTTFYSGRREFLQIFLSRKLKNLAGYQIMWYGYEVSILLSLCNLKGAMQFNCTKDMSMHVLTCSSYNFNTLMLAV